MTMQKITDGVYAIAECLDGTFLVTVEDDVDVLRLRLPRALVLKLVRKLRKRTRNTKARVGDGGPR